MTPCTALALRSDPGLAEQYAPEVVLEAIEKAIPQTDDLDDLRRYREVAFVVGRLCRKHSTFFDRQRAAARVRFLIERRLGELLIAMAERGERATREQNLRRGPKSHADISGRADTLADLYVDPNDASRWARIARIPRWHFEDHLLRTAELTQAGLLALERELRPKPSQGPPPWATPDAVALADLANQAQQLVALARRFLASTTPGTPRHQSARENLRELATVVHAAVLALLDGTAPKEKSPPPNPPVTAACAKTKAVPGERGRP